MHVAGSIARDQCMNVNHINRVNANDKLHKRQS